MSALVLTGCSRSPIHFVLPELRNWSSQVERIAVVTVGVSVRREGIYDFRYEWSETARTMRSRRRSGATLASLDSRTTVGVATEHHETSMIGWAGGLFAALAPGWMFPGTHDRRMYDQLVLDIARKADAILGLAGRRHTR